MVKLTKLRVHRLRHVRPGTAVNFDPNQNVVLGRNATGKTTLLELVTGALSGNMEKFSREAFDVEFELIVNGAPMKVRALSEVREPSASLTDETQTYASQARQEDLEFHFRIEATVEINDVAFTCRSTRHGIEISSELGTRKHDEPSSLGYFLIDIIIAIADSIPASSTRTKTIELFPHFLRVSGSLVRFDESLDVFGRMSSTELKFRHSKNRTGVIRQTFVPEEIVHAASHAFRPDLESAAPLVLSNLPILRSFAETLGFVRCTLRFSAEGRSVAERWTDYGYDQPTFMFEESNGSTIAADRLSFGQKRMLAFLYYLAANPSNVVADELVNGLHYTWIEQATDALRDRQSFLTSQNPLLFDHLSFSTSEDAERRFISCSRHPDGSISWANLDKGQARRFYEAYEAGIQHVGEILKSDGLW